MSADVGTCVRAVVQGNMLKWKSTAIVFEQGRHPRISDMEGRISPFDTGLRKPQILSTREKSVLC